MEPVSMLAAYNLRRVEYLALVLWFVPLSEVA